MLFFLSLPLLVKPQQPNTKSFDLPNKDIYKLLIDKKGFLWIANDFGVTRYDGINFTSFSNPKQNSLAATGLLEDQQGRIWFSNFSGQIFYIENDIMHLLEAFNNPNESSFSRIGLCKNLLVATSSRGLFVLNTATLIGKYIASTNSKFTNITSLAVIKDNVIGYGDGNWFVYKANGLLKNVKLYGNATGYIKNDVSILNAVAKNDTALLISNPSGTISKIIMKGDSLIVAKKLHYGSFINTVTININNNWVNTKTASYSLDRHKVISGLNLTDILNDNEGNVWRSSINNGVNITYNTKNIIVVRKISLLNTDLIVSLHTYKNKMLLGTQNGCLLVYDPFISKVFRKIVFPPTSGTIYNITKIDNTQFLIGCSVNTYLLNINTGLYKQLPPISALKQVAKSKDALYIASSRGLFALPGENVQEFKKSFSNIYNHLMEYSAKDNLYRLSKRCNAVCYNPLSKSLVVAFMDGLYRIDSKGITEILYKQQKIHSPSLLQIGGSVFIATINNGLLVLNNGRIQQKGIKDGLLSKTILRIKLIDNRLWLIGTGALQTFDIKSQKIENVYDLPPKTYAQITDIEKIKDRIYLATYKGLFMLPLNPAPGIASRPNNYLLAIKVNNKQLSVNQIHDFSYLQNNIQFKIGIPTYKYAEDIAIKYNLVSDKQSNWQMTEPGERNISFSSLTPGSYNFVAFAVDPGTGEAKNRINYHFVILAPWWQQWWFRVSLLLFLMFPVIYFISSHYSNKKKFKNAFDEQAASIRDERQRISSEIHDDIGSGLFAIQLFADMASKGRESIKEIGEISIMVNDMSKKIREIIWSTNVENDNLENLLYYVQYQTTSLFEHCDISFEANISDDIPAVEIHSQCRRNIYLVVKELVHNAIKHSDATEIKLDIFIDKEILVISLKDNGIGFHPEVLKTNSMGLANVKLRVEKLKGSILISNIMGAVIEIEIPLDGIAVQT